MRLPKFLEHVIPHWWDAEWMAEKELQLQMFIDRQLFGDIFDEDGNVKEDL